ncbi:hypothetical protein [Nocardioides sp. TF02-7]|uniref:hypothetical protein n=1 Tax=Nocardioides sp. TF02-7 TaxID=2917724 RepID=UPI001F05BE60|nr:hypothetical protein [Nocardioides sp. TF02-7]UMG92557.1 hypothetical protein MF408_22565 [Nocardioides sp. TF02-7]
MRGDVAAAVRRAGVRLLIRGPRALEMTITYRPVSDQDRTIAVPGADEVATSVTSGCGRAA